MPDVQALVDALAIELDRPVGVDDRRFRTVAYSSHGEGVDQVRIASILRREAPAEVVVWMEALGVGTRPGPARIPPNDALDMAARVCVPLRFEGFLLGYIWLIDEPELSPVQLDLAATYGDDLAVALHRARRWDFSGREHELVAKLLDSEDGASEAIAAGFPASAPCYAVFTLSASGDSVERRSDAVKARLTDVAEQLRRSVGAGRVLIDDRGPTVTCVFAGSIDGDVRRRGEAMAAECQRRLDSTMDVSAVVTASEEHPSIQGLPRAAIQARDIARVADRIDGSRAFIQWSDLGAYRPLLEMLGDRDPAALLPDPFRRLLAAREATSLVPTLERYLDLGGDARLTAAQLYLHRSSLYGRLHRIEDTAGVSLRSGESRLELHLGLRLWRLSGGADQAGDDRRQGTRVDP